MDVRLRYLSKVCALLKLSFKILWRTLSLAALTCLAGKLLFICVDSHVIFQVTAKSEILSTHGARIRLLTCVDSPMPYHRWNMTESFSADLAMVWLLACVGSHVNFQVTATPEIFSTSVARKRLLTCVGSYVDCQGTTAGETLPTCFATVRLLTCVDPHVNFQVTDDSELFSTWAARIRLLTCVCSHVPYQCRKDSETFLATVTFERLYTYLSITVHFWPVRFVNIITGTSGFCLSSWSPVSMLAFTLILTLSDMRVVREELVVTFLISRSQHKSVSLLLQYKLLSLLPGAESPLFLFNLWWLWVLLVQTGGPLLITELLVSQNFLLPMNMLLLELCRDRKQRK